MKYTLKLIFLGLLFLTIKFNLYSQNSFFGGPYFSRNYSPEEYKSESQVWCVAQDARGIMYFGTTTQMITFDGTNWKQYSAKNETIIRSLDIDTDGKVFVGGSGEFGYFETDSLGEFLYKSISNKLNEQEKDFQDVWKTLIFKNEVYFITNYKIFTYNKNDYTIKIKTVQDRMYTGFGFKIGDSLLIMDKNKRLCVFKDTTLITFPEIEAIRGYGYIDICEFSADEMIIMTSYKGIYRFNSKTRELIKIPLKEEVFQFLRQNIAKKMVKINDSQFAIATSKGGVIIIDTHGNYINTINKDKGLPVGSIYKIFCSKNKSLWITGENGITRVDINYPIFKYSKNQGVLSYSLHSIFFNNLLYVGTMNGCYFLKPYVLSINNDNQKFRNIKNINSIWNFLELNNNLLTFGTSGIYQIIDSTSTKIYNTTITTFGGIYNPSYPNKLFIGKENGCEILQIIKNETGKIIELESYIEIEGVSERITKITFDNNNNLWLSTLYNGIIYVKFSNDSLTKYELIKYGVENNLPTPKLNKATLFNDEIIILTKKGIYKPIFPSNNQHDSLCTFVHDNTFTNIFNIDSLDIAEIIRLKNNSFAINSDTSGILTFVNDSIIWNQSHYRRINYYGKQNFIIDKYISITSNNNYFIHNLEYKRNYQSAFSVLLRKITLNNDSIIFYGNFYEEHNNKKIIISNQPESFYPILKYNENSITFNFSAIFYEEHEKNKYSYKLIGFDQKWTEFTNETKAKFTNLHEGKYEFTVVAKNVYGHKSQITYFKFKVLPPWYRTWWAYLLYISILLILVFIIIKLALRRVVKAKIKLEKIVKERTAEMYQQKEEILTQAEELQVTNRELEKLSIIAQETDNAVLIFDKNLNLQWTNYAFTKIYGYTFEEYTINRSVNLIKTSNVKSIKKIVNQCITEKKSVSFEEENLKKNGDKLWVQTTLTPIFNLDKLDKIIVIESDITEIKKAQIEISQKNKFITSSINYAKTIQQAILPIPANMNKYLNNFIIYRPKDIVSGDFYWFSVIKPYKDKEEFIKFIAVVDCTGHGVPGAFMSMIANTLLNEIINKEKVYSPREILTKLNLEIQKSLKQNITENRDGMDVCLCKIEKSYKDKEDLIKLKNNDGKKTNMVSDLTHSSLTYNNVTFAGAKRPLFYYKLEDKELVRLKGNRKSIGGIMQQYNTDGYTNQDIILQKNDLLYLTTDGYIDQNNNLRKRFSTKRLKRIITEIVNKPLSKQKQILEAELDKWQGSEKQRDDIAVIGIKL